MAEELTVVCAWCKQHLKGPWPPKDPRRVSHALCDPCRATHFPDLPKKNPGYRLRSIRKSSKKGKKLVAVFEDRDTGRTKTTHFGAVGYSDYTKHKDPERKARYVARHEGKEDWSDPTTPGALSRWVLWDKPSLKAGVASFKRKFRLNPATGTEVEITTKERKFTGGRGEVRFFAWIDGVKVGELFVNFGNAKIRRQPAASIYWIGVDEAYRGRGIATKLYEAANAMACERGRVLASDATLKEGSRGFWEKQRAKGRATRHAETVAGKRMHRYALSCPATSLNPPKTVAALFVDSARGPYSGMPGVDVWDARRDAMNYPGRDPVVAHPSCAPWGRFAWRGEGDSKRDGAKACAPAAIGFVRRYGGVVEHPAGSALWKALDLPRPGEPPDSYGGWTLQVRQVDWGHKAEKKSWLYIVGVAPEDMPPVPMHRKPTHVVEPDSKTARGLPRLPKSERHLTPPAFAKWLVEVARRVRTVYQNPPRGDERLRAMVRAGEDPWRILAERNRLGLPLVEVVNGAFVDRYSFEWLPAKIVAAAVPGVRLTNFIGWAGYLDGIAITRTKAMIPVVRRENGWHASGATYGSGTVEHVVEDLTDVLRDELKQRGLR